MLCGVFASLTQSDQVRLLHGVYSAGQGSNASVQSVRTQWLLLGQPICVRRLASILGVAEKTFYKRCLNQVVIFFVIVSCTVHVFLNVD